VDARRQAVKVLSRQQANDEDMLQRLCKQAQWAARLDHENIAITQPILWLR